MKAHEFIACPRERYKQGETSRDGFSYIKGVVSNEQGETRYWVIECFSWRATKRERSAYIVHV